MHLTHLTLLSLNGLNWHSTSSLSQQDFEPLQHVQSRRRIYKVFIHFYFYFFDTHIYKIFIHIYFYFYEGFSLTVNWRSFPSGKVAILQPGRYLFTSQTVLKSFEAHSIDMQWILTENFCLMHMFLDNFAQLHMFLEVFEMGPIWGCFGKWRDGIHLGHRIRRVKLRLNHTTKITVTFVISHFDIVWYDKNSIPLKYHLFDYVIIQNITSLKLWHYKN